VPLVKTGSATQAGCGLRRNPWNLGASRIGAVRPPGDQLTYRTIVSPGSSI
jgi:hypothetical protein